MLPNEVIELTAALIALRPLSGAEGAACRRLCELFDQLGWDYELIPLDAARANIFVKFGVPEIIFTTHIDVVAASENMFVPRISSGVLVGRGACDALGIAATLIGVCLTLQRAGNNNFGLLLVLEEENTARGAKLAAQALKDRSIRYLINGEPTENQLVSAHKGAVGGLIKFSGKSCHSGYPECGEDANRKLIELASLLLKSDFGVDPELGAATINIGRISGGSGDNIVSDAARLGFIVRTVGDNRLVIDKLKELVAPYGTFELTYDSAVARMLKVPGFAPRVAAFCTDIPNFAALGAQCVLFGPGSIERAHTENEFIKEAEIAEASSGYLKIFSYLAEAKRLEDGATHGANHDKINRP